MDIIFTGYFSTDFIGLNSIVILVATLPLIATNDNAITCSSNDILMPFLLLPWTKFDAHFNALIKTSRY